MFYETRSLNQGPLSEQIIVKPTGPGAKLIFRNRIKICESEASETQYWMEVIKEAEMLSEKTLEQEQQECNELLALFTSIANPTYNKT